LVPDVDETRKVLAAVIAFIQARGLFETHA
jgi:hypothetical protein